MRMGSAEIMEWAAFFKLEADEQQEAFERAKAEAEGTPRAPSAADVMRS